MNIGTRNDVNLIVAIDQCGGIGLGNDIVWNLADDMRRFRTLTMGGHVIMGRNTYRSIPIKHRPLEGRVNIVLSNTLTREDVEDDVHIVKSFSDALALSYKIDNTAECWIIGGEQVYLEALNSNTVTRIELTEVMFRYPCSKMFPCHLLHDYTVTKYEDVSTHRYFTLKHEPESQLYKSRFTWITPHLYQGEFGYLRLLQQMVNRANNGEWRETRNGLTTSSFSHTLKCDLSCGFPLLTTKRMFWSGIVKELLFFLKGSTDATILSRQKVRIWDANTTREFLDQRGLDDYKVGDMGPMYGWQWRHFGAAYGGCNKDYTGEGYDQLRYLLTKLQESPNDRRMMMTTFNPSDVSKSVLAPCHSLVLQFYVSDNKLSVSMYQRSADIFLGVPFNIASTALLTHLIAHALHMTVGEMTITFGDLHMYKEHLSAAKTQLRRVPHPPPKLTISKLSKSDDIDDLLEFLETVQIKDIKRSEYHHRGPIKAIMKA